MCVTELFCPLLHRALGALSLATLTLGAQPPTPSPGAVVPLASLRVRAESWDWFDAGPEGRYGVGHAVARFGATQQTGPWQWRLEGGTALFVGIPTDAVRPAPAGALGLGGVYYLANDRRENVAAIFLRQGWLRWSESGHAVRAGRFEFNDGVERTPKDPTLAALKSQRVGQRLIGSFGFAPAQRAFDGAHYSLTRGANNLTLLAVRPTTGAFRADAQDGLNVNMAYVALNRGRVGAASEMDVRIFGLHYADRRGTVPVDNRTLAVRQNDRDDIRVTTIGGHWVGTRRVGQATLDGLLWGAVQTGDWGALEHRGNAVAVEGGFQHAALPWSLWLRGGWLRTSGDDDASDAQHASFFQVTPTPRLHARFPFYNLMNSSEAFVTASVKPASAVGLRGGVHSVSLAEPGDLWYQGGGAFDRSTFGFVGRPSNGATSLAVVTDLSLTWQARPRIAIELYAANARGGDVIRRIYGGDSHGRFLYLETTLSR